MTKGVFLYREDSQYDDRPWEVYQFPAPHLSRACRIVGDWVIYMEPVKAGRRGYHGVAKVDRITPDPSTPGMYLAIIDPNSYLEFDRYVAFQSGGSYPEESVLNAAGNVSVRAQAAVRPIPVEDFDRIVGLGLDTRDELLPRSDAQVRLAAVAEEQVPYELEQDRVQILTKRRFRDRVVRTTSTMSMVSGRSCFLTDVLTSPKIGTNSLTLLSCAGIASIASRARL